MEQIFPVCVDGFLSKGVSSCGDSLELFCANAFLERGWTVKNITPLSGYGAGLLPSLHPALVVLQSPPGWAAASIKTELQDIAAEWIEHLRQKGLAAKG